MPFGVILRLLLIASLLGFEEVLGAPATTLVPNGLGTSVPSPSQGLYNIQGGTTVGANLFHSFSTFNLGTGDTANFNVTSGISNILARVTGGPSTIDGTITSTIGLGGPLSSANLFLINPAGVMFSANAQVNLGGSFIVSTANYVKFSDDSMFYGDVNHPIQDAGLASAPVSAFGFLPPSPQVFPPQTISFNGTHLTMQPGMGLHVIGGPITLDGAALLAPGGALTMFSAASAAEVPFSLASPGAGFANATVGSLGPISMANGASVGIDSQTGGGGSVVIRGGRVTVDNSYITSRNFGPVVGGNITVLANSLSLGSGGYIGTDSYGTDRAGSVDVEVSGDLSVTGSQISADTESSGAGGVVTANVGGNITLVNGGNIFANTDGAGNGGAVMVQGTTMTISGNISGDNSGLSSVTDGLGNAGAVSLKLNGALTMSGNSNIIADSYTSGNGGDVTVQAGQISMSDQSIISANSIFSSGAGGNILVQAGSLNITNGGNGSPAGITAQSLFGSGNAGTINVATGGLDLNNGAVISTSSVFSGGNGGSVSVSCSQGILNGQSSISSSSTYTNAGSVLVDASVSLSLYSGSTLDTSAGAAGGNITLRVGQLLYLRDSSIVAYAGVATQFGAAVGGNGGNITIDPQFVVLDHSLVSANDLSPVGRDGNIVNYSDFLFLTDSTLHATGTIDTTPPDLELANGLLALPGNLVDVQNKLRESCARSINHEFSSLIVVGRGGTETAPEELQADMGLSLRLEGGSR